MKYNNMFKCFILILIILFVNITLSVTVYGKTNGPQTYEEFTESYKDSTQGRINPDDYESDGPRSGDVASMYKFGGSIAGVIQIVGTIVSAGAMIIIGIRYVIASADEKAEYKERMFPYFIGAVLLFGASNIVNIIYKIFN